MGGKCGCGVGYYYIHTYLANHKRYKVISAQLIRIPVESTGAVSTRLSVKEAADKTRQHIANVIVAGHFPCLQHSFIHFFFLMVRSFILLISLCIAIVCLRLCWMSVCYPCANPFTQMKFTPNGDKQNTIVSTDRWTDTARGLTIHRCEVMISMGISLSEILNV